MTSHGPLAKYVKLRAVHAPETFSPIPQISDPGMHHGTCVTHVPWCMPGSLTSGFLWNRWRGQRSRHSRRMCNAQFYISVKRSIAGIRNDLLICIIRPQSVKPQYFSTHEMTIMMAKYKEGIMQITRSSVVLSGCLCSYWCCGLSTCTLVLRSGDWQIYSI